MKFVAKSLVTALAVMFVVFLSSCDEEINTLGEGVIGGEPFVSDEITYEVFAYNKRLLAVQTNKLPLYQLGFFNDPIYGRTEANITSQVTLPSLTGNPTFGASSQSKEDTAASDDNVVDENELVKEVILYIPYQLVSTDFRDKDGDGVQVGDDDDDTDASSDSDGDGVTDSAETAIGSDPLDATSTGEEEGFVANTFQRSFALDSIYGDIEKPFRLTVSRSTYFLRDLDPNSNFEEAQEYFSDQEFAPGFTAEVLCDSILTVSNLEYLFMQEDNPETEDVDESDLVAERFNPGIRVKLDNDFFQENLLDKEGSSELLSQANFSEFFRGIHLSITPTDGDIMFLLDLRQATITVTYDYTTTTKDEDGNNEIAEGNVELRLIQSIDGVGGGNAVNTILNPNYPESIALDSDNGENASRIYLKGGNGSIAEIRLFDEDDGSVTIDQIKAKNWIINEANLEFYVDREALDPFADFVEPPRLYLYDSETNLPVYNAFTEVSNTETPLGQFLNYDGILEKEDGRGIKYTVRLTEYLNNIIVRDSANVPLHLSLSSDIRVPNVRESKGANGSTPEVPIMSTTIPLGTVLYGGDVEVQNKDKKLRLRLFYTQVD